MSPSYVHTVAPGDRTGEAGKPAPTLQADWARLAPTSGAVEPTGGVPHRPSGRGTKPVKRPEAKPSAASDLWGPYVLAEPDAGEVWYSQADLPVGALSDELRGPPELDISTLWTSGQALSEAVMPITEAALFGPELRPARLSPAELRMRVLDFIKANPRADVGDVALGLGLRLEEASKICKRLRADGYVAYDI